MRAKVNKNKSQTDQDGLAASKKAPVTQAPKEKKQTSTPASQQESQHEHSNSGEQRKNQSKVGNVDSSSQSVAPESGKAKQQDGK